MIIIDLFDIDFHIFTVIKFLFNLVVRFKYIYIIINRHYYDHQHNNPLLKSIDR